MPSKKSDDSKTEKNKVVYDFENDKSKGLLKEMKAKALTDKELEEALNRKLEAQEEADDEENEELEEESEGSILGMIFKTIIFIAVVGFVGACIWAMNSSYFEIKKINITSGTRVSSGDVMPLVSDNIGTNIFLVKTDSMKFKIKQNPHISDVTIKKEYPDTLLISFDERVANSIIKNVSGDLIVDKTGYILKPEADENYDELLTIESFLSKEYNIGDSLSGTDEIKYKNILYLMQVANNINFGYKISNVSYADSNDIKFCVEEAGIEVLYGPLKKEQANDKLLYLREIINKSMSQGLKGYLDMSAENYYEKAVLNSEI